MRKAAGRARHEASNLQAGLLTSQAVSTVSGRFAEAGRKAVIDAAGVVGLVNRGFAVPVNYAMSRTFPPEPSHHLIYDLGSGLLRVTLVSLRSAMLPDPLSLAETPQLKNVTSIEVHGFGYDLKVGGYVFDRAVRDLLVEAFEETTGKPLEEGRKFTDDKRAMAKLLKEAAHVKQVLSAKTAAMARIEGLIDNLDFRTEITRSALESRASSLPAST
ncbi:Hypoxia up-regulated protein 1 [Rhodotorula toruloides]|nr:Hypoxia up-regulated protein 1 [Rhodotorula toruloides]